MKYLICIQFLKLSVKRMGYTSSTQLSIELRQRDSNCMTSVRLIMQDIIHAKQHVQGYWHIYAMGIKQFHYLLVYIRV